MKSINPATGKLIKEYEPMQQDVINRLLVDADKAQKTWAETSFSHRAEKLKGIAAILRDRKKELAELMADEMGKPLPQGVAEAEKCAWVCEYYAEHAAEFLKDQPMESDGSNSYVAFNPLGVVLAIMPWNYPFWQLFRFAAPALMAGNAAVLKHAPGVSGCGLEIERIIHEAGVPKDLFRTVLAEVGQVEAIIKNEVIKAVTLTGSTRAGKAVASQAGSVLKKTVLELGGSDPYVILKDADIAKSAETCVTSRLLNSGQSCIAAKRFIVVKEVYDEFLGEVISLLKNKKVGDPYDEDTDVGPMAALRLRDILHKQVQQSIEKGANCVMGGAFPEGEGAYYPVTLLTDIKPGMPAYEEELFGPAASVIKAEDEDDAVRIANDTGYGLGAAVFSRDVSRAERIAAEKLQAGCCFVNAFVKSDPRLPFGGIKHSGFGRELSHFGIKEFVNIKTVYIA